MPLLAIVWNEPSPPTICACKLNEVDGAREIVRRSVVFQDDDLRVHEFGCQRPVEAVLHIEGEVSLARIPLSVDDQRRIDDNKSRMRLRVALAVLEESEIEGCMSDGANPAPVR